MKINSEISKIASKKRLRELLKLPLNYITISDYNCIDMSWLQEYAKQHNYDVKDVYYCLTQRFYNENQNLIFGIKKELAIIEKVSICFIQRHLTCSFPKATKIINELLLLDIIAKDNEGGYYNIKNKEKLLDFLDIQKKINKGKLMEEKTTSKEKYKYDIFNIISNHDLRVYIKKYLLDDESFILDIDKCIETIDLKSKTSKEREEYFDCYIGNTSRTYIFKTIMLKHLLKMYLEGTEQYLDIYWENKLNRVFKDNSK